MNLYSAALGFKAFNNLPPALKTFHNNVNYQQVEIKATCTVSRSKGFLPKALAWSMNLPLFEKESIDTELVARIKPLKDRTDIMFGEKWFRQFGKTVRFDTVQWYSQAHDLLIEKNSIFALGFNLSPIKNGYEHQVKKLFLVVGQSFLVPLPDVFLPHIRATTQTKTEDEKNGWVFDVSVRDPYGNNEIVRYRGVVKSIVPLEKV